MIAVDLWALAEVMRGLGVEVDGELSGAAVGAGQSNLTYLVADESGNRWVVRRPPLGNRLASAHDVEREARIMAALEDTAVPVPEVICTVKDPAVADVTVVVMECVEGLVVNEMPAAESLPLAVRGRLSQEVARTLAKVHAVDLERQGLSGLASQGPYAARQLRRWTRQWEQSKTRELPELEAVAEVLQRSAPPQRAVMLVHGDFHIRNLICNPEDGRIRAVLDWELATLGDPLADVGTMLAYWTQQGDEPLGIFAGPSLPGFLDRETLVDEYCAAAGVDGEHIGYWNAFGLWKIAVIAEGVNRRALDHPTHPLDDGPGTADGIKLLVEEAREVLSRAGLV